jgi:hypothetical protein
MNRFRFLLAAFFAVLFTAAPALALSTQSGNSVAGPYNMNLADPDEQAPPFLKSPGNQASVTNRLNSENPPPVIVHRNILPPSAVMPSDNDDAGSAQK